MKQARKVLQAPEELALVEQKVSQLGTVNREAYLRKMALDGYVVKLDLPELKELVFLLCRNSNNLNQLIRKVHETGRVYDSNLEDISHLRREKRRSSPRLPPFFSRNIG
ncbi:plasmid mobilization protein [Parablautia intestinalis]|uniref:plasmid mobilization protein n=1 Tax=Parablautia intestinalis TaxID=2320100 RepID=UPI0024121CC4|nr:plasmid mobilization relaxosome protein MobC [Parablautia intestinalis]